jgi:crotonobetainyl-CoA:carnitine CoA-transferase CaiB-like acyl-CoA transferase
VSLQAAVASSLEHVPGWFHQDGRVPRRQGRSTGRRFFRVGRCRDGWVMHCTLGDWTSLLEWMRADGFGDALGDAAWEGTAHRATHAEALFAELDRWAARYTVAELHEGAQLRRLPYAAVRAPEALLDDPQLEARGFLRTDRAPGARRNDPVSRRAVRHERCAVANGGTAAARRAYRRGARRLAHG